jgi:hypothetical protein
MLPLASTKMWYGIGPVFGRKWDRTKKAEVVSLGLRSASQKEVLGGGFPFLRRELKHLSLLNFGIESGDRVDQFGHVDPAAMR